MEDAKVGRLHFLKGKQTRSKKRKGKRKGRPYDFITYFLYFILLFSNKYQLA